MNIASQSQEFPQNHPPVRSGKTGVLLINLGTPDATSYWPMRRYLKEFLSDRRVVEANRVVWWLVLNGIILSKRPQKSGAAYDVIWNRERDESPLKTFTRSQAEKLAIEFAERHDVIVDWAMRYGNPSIADKISSLKAQGCDHILFFPLYPQYSAATTATAMDKVFDALKAMRWQPAIRTVPPYFDHAAYIDALATGLEHHLENLCWKPEVILASFHGLPVSFHQQGDPYYCHCEKTVRVLRKRLAMDHDNLQLTFQSRSGRKEWLKPYTEESIAELAGKGIKNLVVFTPGFAADCLETLEEIDIRARQAFLTAGGVNFSTQPCLNDSPDSISMLAKLAHEQLSGWQ